MLRIVADLGNSRLKWGRLDGSGAVEGVEALPTDDPEAWERVWSAWNPGGAGPVRCAVATVNPPAAARLAAFLGAKPEVESVRWLTSAASVNFSHALDHPETAGADRALAVAAATAESPPGRPGLVVLCGTAVTVERVGDDGVWQGGAIAAGLGLTARALHLMTAQLPRVEPREAPPAWGTSTTPALEAGVFWGVVGGVRELLTRQAVGLSPEPWVVWTGGDAEVLARAVAWAGARVVPDLVLRGVARVAFAPGGG